MEADKEVVVIHNLNMNDGKKEDTSIAWENSFALSDASSLGSFPETDFDAGLSRILEKDYEFIKQHVTDADPDFIHSLLLSQSDNPKRLESVMCEVLNIPNALELIKNYRKNNVNVGEKRVATDTHLGSETATNHKRRKSDGTEEYLNRISEMFPDVHEEFLLNECKHIKNKEDFSRFISTVMLSGVYTKKNQKINIDQVLSPAVIDITNDSNISEIIDITESNDSTQSYKPPDENSLTELYNAACAQNKVDALEENVSTVSNNEGPFDEEINNILERRNHIDRDEGKSDLEGVKLIEPEQNSILANYDLNEGPSIYYSPEPTTSKQNDLISPRPDAGGLWETYDSEVNEGFESGSGDQEETNQINEKEWVDDQTANLIRIFPNTDPSFLKEEVIKMNKSADAMNAFVIAKLERNDMPTRADYEKKREMEELQNRYTKNFSIEDFLKAIPDPWKHFTEGNRNCAKYERHSLCYLRSTFKKHYVRDIINVFRENKSNLYLSYKTLKMKPMKMRGSRRSEFECNVNRPTTIDIQFLQEVAFIENEEKIQDYIKGEEIARKIKFEEAKAAGSLLECQCCFDSEVMVEDTVYCPKDHAFCRDCVVKCVEVEMGNGKSQFNCLATCDEKFTLASLQSVLKPELFSKVIQANQMEEIQAAGIEDLVQCPFCTYATIMPPEQKVMTCLNPECLKESCRLCKELNHIPLKCDEVEKSEEVKLRTFIENKMTEALVRTCYKCSKKFVKEDGCNKMTCTCGAKMCYVCRKPVTDYSHFNGQGGTEYHKCPLYSTNDELHVDLVQKVGEEAKAKILQANPQTRLIHDPTVIMPERTHDRPMPGMNNRAARNRERRAIRELLGEPGNEENEEENDDGDDDGGDDDHHHRRRRHNHHQPRGNNFRGRQQLESDDDDDDDDDDDYNEDEDSEFSESEEDEEEEVEEEEQLEEEKNNGHHNHRHHHHHHHHHRHRHHHHHNHHRHDENNIHKRRNNRHNRNHQNRIHHRTNRL